MARKKGPRIVEAARELAGNKIDNRYTDLVEGHIADAMRDIAAAPEALREAMERELGLGTP